MLLKKAIRFIITGVLGLCLFIGAGYISNGISRSACEGKVLEKIFNRVGSRKVFVPSKSHPNLTTILSRFGFDAKRCPLGEKWEKCFPLVIIDPPNIWKSPFVLSVDWTYAKTFGNGEGMRTHFLCFFGWAISVKEHLEWIE